MLDLRTPWIQTASGKRFAFNDPTPDMVCIEDVAHALARLCRWTGHVGPFYSVAEHCIRVSYDVPREFALDGLLHDAREAYVADVSSPLKVAIGESYRIVEKRAAKAVAEHFGIAVETPSEVVASDLRLLSTERRDLLSHHIPWGWSPPAPLEERIVPIATIDEAEAAFLSRFHHLDALRKGVAAQ